MMSNTLHSQYSNTYNGVNYNSTRPYNLNVVYFVPNDIPLDTSYKARLSPILLWAQNFVKQNMINNGYGAKTFGLFTENGNPNSIKIILINGSQPSSAYPYGNYEQQNEVNNYFVNNPSQKTSEHILIITATASLAGANVPFYGTGRTCFALDYPDFNIQNLGTNLFTTWFGGLVHELGHGLNLPHSHETNTENSDPNKGMSLMFAGNSTLGESPTFINRAGAAILNNSQTFADVPGIYYDDHSANFSSIHTAYNNGILTVSGTFQSNKTVKDINIYQDPSETPIPIEGYYKTAWSTAAVGNTYSISMPVSEISTATNGPYNLQIELVLENGEIEFVYFPFYYTNGVPDININFDSISTCVGNSLQFTTHLSGIAYRWQYLSGGEWYDYPEGTNTQTSTMEISNISSAYIPTQNTVRVAVTQADGSMKYDGVQTWKAIDCSTLATSETKENNDQNVYPNPLRDELIIDLGYIKERFYKLKSVK